MPHVPDNQRFRGKHGTTVQPLSTYYKTPTGNTEAPVRIGAAPGTRPGITWDALTTIYRRTADDNGLDLWIKLGADDLKAQIEKVRPTPAMSIVTTNPDGVAIRLLKDSTAFAAGAPEDSYKILVDPNGITITGKSPLAVRNGVYGLLDALGFRFLMMNEKWTVVPPSLTMPTLTGQVVSPTYPNREVIPQAGPLQDVAGGQDTHRRWRERNRLPGADTFSAVHSYDSIWKLADAAATNPESVCFNPDNGLASTLEPTDPEVLVRAKAYADYRVANFPSTNKQYNAVVSISPLDGAPKCPSWYVPTNTPKFDYQLVSDSVLYLTNEVAKHLATTAPGKFAGVLSYNVYFLPPAAFRLEPNVYVSVTTGIGIAAAPQYIPSTADRMAGLLPAKIGFYEYWHVWQYTHDRTFDTTKFAELVANLRDYHSYGASVYRCEAGINWGAKGLHYWKFGRLLWDKNLDSDALTVEFCTYAYGPASSPMTDWHRRWDTVTTPATTMEEKHALGFPDLATALDSVPASGAVADRIRQIILWAYYDWRWGAAIKTGNVLYNMTQAEMEAWYRFVWRVTAEQIITTKYEKERGAKELKLQYPAAYPDDASLAPLKDLTPYTATEVRAFLDAALSGTP